MQESNSKASQLMSSSVNFAKSLLIDTASKVNVTQERLDHVASKLKEVMDLLGSPNWPNQLSKPCRPVTSSFLTEAKVFGRDSELAILIELLGVPQVNEPESSNKRSRRENVSVLPIVGIGGVGKTTLAQLVYNDPRVQEHFRLKIWICVSDNFDVTRLTNEMLEIATSREQSGFGNLDSLQVALRENAKSRRFLLVLDDVWSENKEEWQRFFAPLKHAYEGSMIVITTRSKKVAQITGTMDMEPFVLQCLPGDVYWEFFQVCAFGKEISHPEMENIGKRICAKLKGSPLGAKTLGSLLNLDLSVRHWSSILNSEMWQLKQEEHDIIPVLQLSYLYLPPHLKQCFSICSLYPKDRRFAGHELIDYWIMLGYIIPLGTTLLEDIAKGYLQDLISRSFFQEVGTGLYVMHDLVHDMAQSVTLNECYRIEHIELEEKCPSHVRHLSIFANERQVSKLDLSNNKRLCSFIVKGCHMTDVNRLMYLFNELNLIRVLILSRLSITELPESIGDLRHLRSLDISFTRIQTLPKSFCRLYNLQILKMVQCRIIHFPGCQKLISLQTVKLDQDKLVYIAHMPNFAKAIHSLQEFRVTPKEVSDDTGSIKILKHMSQLHGTLWLSSLENIASKEDAEEANINKKEHIERLKLSWFVFGGSFTNDHIEHCEEVIEGLCPHTNLLELIIQSYRGAKSPSWLQPKYVPNLTKLEISSCRNLRALPSLPPSIAELKLKFLDQLDQLPSLWDGIHGLSSIVGTSSTGSWSRRKTSSLSVLEIDICPKLTTLSDWLLPEYVPAIKQIRISQCSQLVLLPVERFGGFVSLERLQIEHCPKLTCPKKLALPPSMRTLRLILCGELEMSLSNCLRNLTSLIDLIICDCSNIKSVPLNHLKALDNLCVSNCEELRSLGDKFIESVKNVFINGCPRLEESSGEDIIIGNPRY